ncbi:hypothetical protein ACFL4T_07550 [candidate division KSB1 bacterium]
MKRLVLLLLVSFFLVSIFSCGAIFKKKGPELAGTWKGTAAISIESDMDIITMIITKDGDKYSGKITDSIGYLNNTPLKDIVFTDNTLTFSFDVVAAGSLVETILTYENGTLKGEFETTDGQVTGIFELKKEKEK